MGFVIPSRYARRREILTWRVGGLSKQLFSRLIHTRNLIRMTSRVFIGLLVTHLLMLKA